MKIILIVISISCSPVKKLALSVDVLDILKKSEVFSSQHTGFSLYDLDENTYIAKYNADLLFTPASNTKLLTMFATLSSYQDSIPAFLYEEVDSGVYVQPVGEPTFLLEDFKYQPAYGFLSAFDSITILKQDPLMPFASGWAWDDYSYAFQVQRTWWPIYGNTINISKLDSSVTIDPIFFQEFVEIKEDEETMVSRDIHYNIFQVSTSNDTTDFDRRIPFEYSEDLFLALLADTLKGSNFQFSYGKLSNPDTLFSQHVDTVLARMLKPSDNFLAEQLLIMCAWKNGFTEIEDYITALKNDQLKPFGEIVWVDGSGLSRYNLVSPDFQIRLLKESYNKFGWDRLKAILPTGGEGTLEGLYLSHEPYIYAKTGTLSNNHNLSGFLITRSGKRLIFSIMNNHYLRPTIEIKKAMESLLIEIRNAY